MIKRFAALLVVLGALLGPVHGVRAAPANNSYNVGVCDPSYGARCIKPNADGSINSTATLRTYATTDKSGTVTLGGTAQTAIAANASRKVWCLQNTDAAEVMYVRVNGTASATTGTKLVAGAQACNNPGSVDTALVSVFAATTSHPYSGFEGQ